ncbi:MAG TPA: c-type cytochrome [Micropepsaceae bacterium]|jgi:mono/diheme cytochrome c family protein|nr:c-type cytochrome [Micropepsaceae bacterium]
MMMRHWLCLAASALFALVASGASAADAPRGDAAKGKQLFTTNGCSYCHGTVGQGGGGRTGGLRIANMGLGFPAFLNQLRQPANEMPPYVASALPDAAVADIFAYIASLPPPPDVKSIPILNN